jgi:DNA invertase Pin-like site-specific DNA recombinase
LTRAPVEVVSSHYKSLVERRIRMAKRRRKRRADPKIVVGYIRVSTDEQALGPEAQREAIETWCEGAGATLVAVHADIGVSGGTPVEKRPGLNAALDALAEHGAGVLLVAKRDRLARDVVIGAVAERLVERLGARVLAADGTGNGDGPEQQLMRHLINAFAEYERMVIGARTKAALRVKKLRGERVGAIPLGYRLSDKEEGKLEEDPHEQGAIALVHELREKGLTLRAIDKALRAKGFRPRGGRRWHVQTLSNILRANDVAVAG